MKKMLFLFGLIASLSLASCEAFTELQQTGEIKPKTVSSASSSQASMEESILELINKYRKSKGLGILKMHVAISDESKKHSANMANNKVPFSHEGFNSRAKKLETKIPGMKSVAENVAYGQRSAKEVVEDWIKSPGHKMNIEWNYTQTGIGIAANKKGVLYYTQIFVR
jgi:uncharacterized protein YkwD